MGGPGAEKLNEATRLAISHHLHILYEYTSKKEKNIFSGCLYYQPFIPQFIFVLSNI
jgi:hypothetical protein